MDKEAYKKSSLQEAHKQLQKRAAERARVEEMMGGPKKEEALAAISKLDAESMKMEAKAGIERGTTILLKVS